VKADRHKPLDDEARTVQGALPPVYLLQHELGSGGMARVFLAEDRKHRRRVAIKVLREELSGGRGAERFVAEIGLTARLSHPHILPLLDSGTADGRPFYVMPVVEGESLRERLDRTPRLALLEALRIAHDVADALAYAHAQGVVHRDIKPENIMLSGRHALVADFGIARAIEAINTANRTSANMTGIGMVVGTPAYMSPEQASGDPTVDGRSDVCSLGVVLFEMLAGECPYVGPNAGAILLQQLGRPVPSLRARRPELPEVLEFVVATAMARAPEDRFASAAEFADTLASLERSIATGGEGGAQALAPQVPHVPSLAILPFDNLSTDQENAFLSDGIAEEVLTLLSKRQALRVCARSSSFAFRGQGVDLRTVGDRLGVRTILTGSVRRAGDRLRVNAELVNVADGTQLWTERYERRLDDIFAIQDDIAGAIVAALNATLLSRDVAAIAPPTLRTPVANVAAYEACLRGRHLWGQRTSTSAAEAMGCYLQALAMAPDFVPAWTGLADVWATRGIYGTVAPAEAMEQARDAANRALALEAESAEAHATLGLIHATYDWRWEEAERAFRRAIARRPNYPTAHQWLATNYLTPLGLVDDALEATTVALRLDPLSLVLKCSLASAYFYGRRYDEAAAAARDAIGLDADFPLAHFFLGQSLLYQGEMTGAVAACRTAVELSGRSSETLAALGVALASSGDEGGARATLAELDEARRFGYVSPCHPALVQVALGAHDEALDGLERALGVRAADLAWIGVRPSWDALRALPRFQAIAERVGVGSPGAPPDGARR
jgi:serine/threonine-protein kinase